MLERHTATRRKAATELLDSSVNHYAALPDTEGTFLSALGDHAAFQASARMLKADITKEIDPLLDPAARDILKTQDEVQRANTMTLPADGECAGWKPANQSYSTSRGYRREAILHDDDGRGVFLATLAEAS